MPGPEFDMKTRHFFSVVFVATLFASAAVAAPPGTARNKRGEKAAVKAPIAKRIARSTTKGETVMISGVPIARVGKLKNGQSYQFKGRVLHLKGERAASGRYTLLDGRVLRIDPRGAYIDPAIP